jgi:hypothetical protein
MLQRLLVFLLLLYVTAVVFAPPITASGWLSIDDAILVFAALLSILPRLKSKGGYNSKLVVMIVAFAYLILLIMLLSTLMAGFYTHYEYSGLFKEILRLGKYLLVVFLALSIAEKRYQQFITYWVIGLGILVVITQIAQYAGGMGFNQIFAQFYGGHPHFSVALNPLSREGGYFFAGGPFANPNVASSFLIIPFVLSFYYVFRGFDKSLDNNLNSGKMRIIFIFVTFFIFLGILLTDSRAAIVTLPVVMLFFLYMSRSSEGRIVSFVAVVVPLTILLLFAPAITNKGPIFAQISEGLGDGGSFAVKMTSFQNGLQQMGENRYWWGFGAGDGPHVDFELALFVMWYGVPGLLVYLLFWVTMILGVVKYRAQFRDWQAIVAIILAFFLVNFSQSTFLNVRVFPIFIVIFLMNFNREKIVRESHEHQAEPAPNSMVHTA